MDVNQDFRACAYSGDLQTMKNIVKYVDVNGSGPTSGKTALHRAVEGGRTNVICFLLSIPNINRNIPDNEGNAPLHTACDKMELFSLLCMLLKKRDLIDTEGLLDPIRFLTEPDAFDINWSFNKKNNNNEAPQDILKKRMVQFPSPLADALLQILTRLSN